ncbi:WD40 repeat-like protein [Heliocybe sulcata]|uniref:WD40 repeat-like protein n=1 Tax=Heliocybe sulcata TaxID=5364 RepID=A0A5C3NF21_9AGAM|nr:WD40 repeat-like protein [Heliocybe sulcata]
MLAVITADALGVIPPSELRHGSSSFESLLASLEERPTAVSWSPDGNGLFIASARSILKYDPSLKSKETVYISTTPSTINHFLSKDKGNTHIFSAGNKVFILECGSNVGKVSKTFESHKSNITSLSLSNDCTLLATTSSDSAHVYNLTLASHTVLRGLPITGGQKITASSFHPHSRGRLFLGIGKQIVVYDTTRPSAPLKLILMPEGTGGEIIAIACSPFSKTLVAVATTNGDVGLVDLEKDKSPRLNFNVKVPITSLLFAPEGDAIYIGTENGKVMVKSLRTMDKAPLSFPVSNKGSRIIGMSVLNKIKSSEPKVAVPSRKPTERQEPAKHRTEIGSKAKTAKFDASSTRSMRTKTTLEEDHLALREKEVQVFSPVRDPLGNGDSFGGDISVKIETLIGMKPAKAESVIEKPAAAKKEKASRPASVKAASPDVLQRPVSAVSTRGAQPTSHMALRPGSMKMRAASPDRISRPASVLSAHVAEQSRNNRSKAKTDSATSARSKTTGIAHSDGQRGLSTSPSSSVPSSSSSRPLSSTSRSSASSMKLRTPSPELPSPEKEPTTPAPPAKAKTKGKRAQGVDVLGLGTPEVDAWVEAGKGKEKEKQGSGASLGRRARVNFLGEELPAAKKTDEKDAPYDSDQDDEEAGERSLVLSPARAPPPGNPAVSSPGHGSSAQDLLRTIVQDVMYDFQRDTKAEMTGLHLDLVRMRRAWRREMQEGMVPYLEEMRELREENRRLREENDRLKRGF